MQDILFTLFGEKRWSLFLKGYGNTLIIALAALIIGVVIGFILALFKIMPRKYWYGKVLGFLADVYLAVIRGTPVLVQLMLLYFVFLGALDIPALLVAIIGFGINSGAYVAEIVRSGILAVPKGQTEAGRSLGLSYGMTMLKIVFPQAIKNILPALGNEAIMLVKETSVASVITVTEFWNAAKYIGVATYDIYAPYLFAAGVYLITVLLMTFVLSKFERRLRKGDKR